MLPSVSINARNGTFSFGQHGLCLGSAIRKLLFLIFTAVCAVIAALIASSSVEFSSDAQMPGSSNLPTPPSSIPKRTGGSRKLPFAAAVLPTRHASGAPYLVRSDALAVPLKPIWLASSLSREVVGSFRAVWSPRTHTFDR